MGEIYSVSMAAQGVGGRTASNGCIIIDGVSNREQIMNSGDTILVVK